MNYKAIATIVLLLLPMLAVPITLANQPPPQLWNVEFRVRPQETKFYGPCVVSTMFPIDVYLWNDKTLTNTGVYAYDFYIYWFSNAGISLSSLVVHIPWASGKYFIVRNETGTFSPTIDFYHLAVTAVGNETLDPSLELGSNGVFNASLVTLNFHIDSEPCWPGVNYDLFFIGNELGAEQVLVPWPPNPIYLPHVTQCTGTITNIEIENGEYWLYSSQPNIDPLVAANDPGRVNDHIFKEDSIGETHTITIALSNITGAYGFSFHLTWDADWYDTDIQHVTILPAFAPPYETLSMVMGQGTLDVTLIKPCEKPGIHAAGYTPVVTVSFVTTNTPEVGVIPFAANTTFAITSATLFAKCPDLKEYYLGTDHGPTTLWYSGDIIQMFVPKSLADLNIDGVVDIADLAAIAKVYGTVHPWSGLVAPSGTVDIYDIVYVAKRQGDP